MNDAFHWAPREASTLASRYDFLFFTEVGVCAVVALLIAGAMVVFCVRYRRDKPTERRLPKRVRRMMEIGWITIPLLIFIGMFVWGAVLYASIYRKVPGELTVFVVAKQWMWKVQHPNGRREIDEMHLPLGKPIRVVLATEDVIHSFYVPAFRVKQDTVPGRYTAISFTPTMVGRFPLRCAEYCGTDHALMEGTVIVMPPQQYQRWLAEGTVRPSLAAEGAALFRSLGCSGCHSARSAVHAPDLHGLFGRPVHLSDGRTVIADGSYIHDSIVLPEKDVVAGFQPIMPSFKGEVDEEQILQIIAYLKSLGEETPK